MDVMQAKVCVVIVNYRTPELALDCLRSLAVERGNLPALTVYLVEGGSGDGSADKLRSGIDRNGWQSWVTFLPLERNGGYAVGNNAAIRQALESPEPPDYIHLLNPDTIVRPGAIKVLRDFLVEHPHVGIAASALENLEGGRRCTAFRFPGILSEFDQGIRLGLISRLLSSYVTMRPDLPVKPCPTDWAPGASLMIRREVFDSIGLLDEDYFLYFEETDFILRAARAGWPCYYVPESRVVHFIGQSSGVTIPTPYPRRRPKYWFESRRRYFTKNYGLLYNVVVDCAFSFGFIIWKARCLIQHKSDNYPPHFFYDFVNNSTLLNWKRIR